jgi:ATP-grasp domain, R2K clade family 2
VPVWVSEPVEFVSEWRVFVRNNKILGAKPYKGNWRGQYDHRIIEAAVKDYEPPRLAMPLILALPATAGY